ncbi:hypothetical protein ACVDG3_19990 [Meridianimarinicoccus sp. RP-17]|uniref:hypothetical protein n=1 Tax=Meridianimarinicoccus zhengii TaxID=2056810 RepID=UPI000DAE1D1E|nr:hypothetical protein [Phycocomes zhengii]
MTSPNLAAPHVLAAQNQKEVTVNDAVSALDLAMTATLDVDCTAGGTVAVSVLQAQRHVRLLLTGAPGAAFVLRLPDVPRILAIANGTGQIVTVDNATGAAVNVPAGAQVLVHASGSGVSAIGAAAVAPEPEVAQIYDFGMTAFAAPDANAVLGKVSLPRAVTLAADLVGSRGHVDTAPAADFVISITVNGLEVGTATVGTDGAVVFAATGSAPVDLLAGDVVRFVAPAVADAAIAGIALTLAGEVA